MMRTIMIVFIIVEIWKIRGCSGSPYSGTEPLNLLFNCTRFEKTCPPAYRCMMVEEECKRLPCAIQYKCLPNKEVEVWQDICLDMACSVDNCFLRQPRDCTNGPCYMIPDCLCTQDTHKRHGQCKGFICPHGTSNSKDKKKCDEEVCPVTALVCNNQ